MTASRFNTLLLREWMQHHRGWLALMLAPPLLVLLIVPFGSVDIGPNELGPMPSLGLMLIVMAMVPLVVLGLTALSVLFQAPGLARRDRQDRSIEFWLSLPTSHAASIGATLLMHLLLVPLLALVVGAVFGVVIGFAIVWKGFGVAAAFGLPWGVLAWAGGAGLLRALLGVVLACAWLLPIVLLTMAASAWLKRWGLPVLAIVLGVGDKLLTEFYGIGVIGDVIQGLLLNAKRAMVHGKPPNTHGAEFATAALMDAPAWFVSDGLAALRDLAQPLFLLALLVSAACFALLVLRRARNG